MSYWLGAVLRLWSIWKAIGWMPALLWFPFGLNGGLKIVKAASEESVWWFAFTGVVFVVSATSSLYLIHHWTQNWHCGVARRLFRWFGHVVQIDADELRRTEGARGWEKLEQWAARDLHGFWLALPLAVRTEAPLAFKWAMLSPKIIIEYGFASASDAVYFKLRWSEAMPAHGFTPAPHPLVTWVRYTMLRLVQPLWPR